MATRHYFRSSIDELERLFESSKGDCSVLNELHEELSHRNRPRAKALAKIVSDQLATLGKPKPTEKPTTSKQSASSARESEGSHPALRTPSSTISTPSPKNNEVIHPNSPSSTPIEQELRATAKPYQPAAPVDFGNATPQFAPEVETKPGPDSVLAAWLTLEVLTPQALPDARELETIGRTLVRLDEYPEPWNERRFWRRGKERTVYWMVYLGELDLAKATGAILKIYPDDAIDERSDVRGNTTLAVMVLDSQGRPVEDKTFLSSFAWGYGQVRAGRLKGLAGFAEADRAIKTELEKRLIRQDEEGKILPLTNSDIVQTIGWLTRVLNLPDEEVLRPGVAIRVPQWGAYNEAPEPELLNSFFIDDLVKARVAFGNSQVGQALSAYMGAAPAQERQDVVRDKSIVAKTLAPDRMPLARWPGQGRYPLVLMQQAAINHSVAELATGDMVAVNGPPGTGKTTLLRDIVAKVVLDRAVAMSKFDKPAQAFSHTTTMKTGQAFTHLYQLDESLIGHEIVVASSNNKAVENISREIPSATAIADDLNPPARYFQSISDAVAAGKDVIIDGATWGLAAAVLGNSANRSAFIQSFWWHKKRGMALYLKAVLGGDIPEDEDIENEEIEEQKVLDVVTIEQPPRSEIEALERWQTARRGFLAKLKTVEGFQKQAQAGYEAVRQRPDAARRVDDAARTLTAVKQYLTAAVEKEEITKRLHVKAADTERNAMEDRAAIDRLRPGFFARLFWTRSYREWRMHLVAAIDILNRSRAQLQTATEAEEMAAQESIVARKKVSDSEMEMQKAVNTLSQVEATIEAIRKKAGPNLADERFWAQEDNSLQLQSPWIFEEWQKARDALFLEAFALHRAFIDAAAKPLRHNLRAALDVMKGRVLKEQQEPARRSLWASLFLVVPVISTTFASTARLFGPLGREQLGWLLIDEAGQAVPQAAIGALWRARRAIVIGDPLQIPPVVTIPPKLIRAIFSEFKVNTEEWAAPEMSAQTLADRVSWFGTDILTDDGDIWVGSPLRVHRRCENPMFKISNHVAYNGLMVYGTPPGTSKIGKVLGESLWLNVDSDATGKWSETEGRWACDLLRKLLDEGVEDPDIFFITPFRIVAHKLREAIRSDHSIASRLPGKPWEWTRDRVGTIHTFQGKEADTVVIVLGAPLDSSFGARRWAGHPPNLLNVAVTRAKRRLYVIGNREAWKSAGAFSHLAQMLQVLGRPRPPETEMTPLPRDRHESRNAVSSSSERQRHHSRSEPQARTLEFEMMRCVSCGAPAIPGDNVCYQCKSD